MKTLTFQLFLITMIFAQGLFAQKPFDASIKNNSLAISPDEKIAVVSYSDSTKIKVYDLSAAVLKTTIKDFINPRNILFSPDGKFLYITDSSLGYLMVYDTKTFELLKKYPVGYSAFGTAISSNGQQLFVNNEAASTVTVINPIKSEIDTVISGFHQPRQGVKLNADNTKLYVTNFGNDHITVVDAKTFKIEGEIEGFDKIRAISISNDGSTLYAANSGSNELLIVDLTSKKMTQRISVGKDNYGASLSPDGSLVLSGNKVDNTVSVVDVKNHKNIYTIKGFKEPRQAIVFSKDGKFFYVLNNDLSVDKVRMEDYKIIRSMK